MAKSKIKTQTIVRALLLVALVFLAGIPALLLGGTYFGVSDEPVHMREHSFVIVISSLSVGMVLIFIALSVAIFRSKKLGKFDHTEAREIDVLGKSLHGLIDKLQENESLAKEKAFFAEKMAAIGEMSSGLAHEMNNVLMPIQGYAKMLKDKVSPEDLPKVNIIYENATYGINLVKNMLTFSRATKESIRSINIVRVIYDAEKLLHFQVKKRNIDLVLPPFNLDYSLEADEDQIKQVFINLLLNAIHAVEDGGKIVIDVREEKHTIVITITDDGCGMDQETLTQIFKPFVTTKQGGIGLGLSVTYSIIQFHGGDIDVKSHPGEGTTFTILLPMYRL